MAPSAADATIADLLGRCLRAVGVRACFGAPGRPDLPGVRAVPVDGALAPLLADASGRIGPGPGAAWVGPQTLRLSSVFGADADPHVVRDPAELPLAVASWRAGRVHAAVELVLDLDLGAPAPSIEPVELTPAGAAPTLDPSMRDVGVVVLAGPGVVHAGRVDDLAALAHHGGIGVVNTWGAKGVFAWDDPAHHGTVGLQAEDATLAGIDEAGLVLAVGLDPAEAPPERWGRRPTLEVAPEHLVTLTMRWSGDAAIPPPPPLYRALAAALAPSYAATQSPLPAPRAAADLADVLPADGLVAAQPGTVGLWVARCLPTRVPGSVLVPAQDVPGAAMALGAAAVLAHGRPAVVVTEEPTTIDEALADLAAATGTLVWEQWTPDGGAREDPANHRAGIVEALAAGGGRRSVCVQTDATSILTDVAGPVVAWRR